MGVGTVTTREKAESKGKCTAGQSSGQVMLVPLDQCPGQCIHSAATGSIRSVSSLCFLESLMSP